MAAIVSLTLNPAVDRSAVVDRVVPEHKLRCTEPGLEPGGGGINVARATRQLGTDALALWTRGGATGDLLASLLELEGLPHRPIDIGGDTRENFSIYESSSTLQYRFNLPGPTFTEACQRSVLRELSSLPDDTSYLVLSGSLPDGVPDDFYAAAAEAAPAGCRVVVDTSGEALKASVARGGFFGFKPNLRELSLLLDRPLEGDADIKTAARTLLKAPGSAFVLVSLGAGGALMVTEADTFHIRAPTVPIRSKVGAGDSTVAGLVHGLARGWDWLDAARYGVAAGAAAVMTDGSQLCTREDTERLYRWLVNGGP
jgi:6-phosphofructokinase 2